MAFATTRWTLRDPDAAAVRSVSRGTGVGEVTAALLVARGFADLEGARAHLRPSAMGLHDPGLLPSMGAATERLARAMRDGETILVHGDYDVDGVTGTALLMRLFEVLGARARWHIPNRLEDGYSFGPHSIERAEAEGARVVVSVDNGTSAFETLAALAERGIDTVVTDHHEPPEPHPEHGPLPPAAAIVNPKLAGSTYPWRELCGGAVAFKLAWGLAQHVSGGGRVRSELKAFLEEAMAQVAIATLCDVVPLADENRILARYGLRALESTRSPGLRALLETCGVAGRPLRGDDVGFQIGPRINASGRLGSARRAVELFLADDPGDARRLAGELDRLNDRRKEIERGVLAEARAQAADFPDREEHPMLVLAGEGWHQGVVGIVAARIAEELARPALVIGLDGEAGRGSARSSGDLDVLEILRGGAEHMGRFGGHAQAAGCEIAARAVPALRAALCARARELGHAAASPVELAIDREIPLAAMDEGLMRELDLLEPFGAANEAPVFLSRGLRLAEPARAIGPARDHLLLRVRSGAAVHKALGFGMAGRAAELAPGVDLHAAYTPRWNTFRGETRLELLLRDLRVGALDLATVGSR